MTVVAHSLGGLIALHLAAKNPGTVTRLVLFGPIEPPPEAGQKGLRARGKAVRDGGMGAVADTVIGATLAAATLQDHPEVTGFARELLSRQQPEGYALACEAAAASAEPEYEKIKSLVTIVSGAEDRVSAPATCESIANKLKSATVDIVSWDGVGHWHTLENPKGGSALIRKILGF